MLTKKVHEEGKKVNKINKNIDMKRPFTLKNHTYYYFFTLLHMKTEPIIKLCNAIPIAVCGENRNGSSNHEEAIEVCQKFKKLFSKFAICHNYILGKSGSLEVKDLACLGIPI